MCLRKFHLNVSPNHNGLKATLETIGITKTKKSQLKQMIQLLHFRYMYKEIIHNKYYTVKNNIFLKAYFNLLICFADSTAKTFFPFNGFLSIKIKV